MRRLREERGVSLRDIADHTKLSVRTLEALERNDISLLPGGIYSRGLVRAYAEQIGADPETAVREFIDRFPDASVTTGSPYVTEEINTDPPSQLARRMVIAAAIVVPIAVIVALSMLANRLGW
jgi:cytoskeletal protein RodZ